MKYLALFLLCVMLPSIIGGCRRAPSLAKTYGIAHNPERQRRGIPLVPSAWSVKNETRNSVDFVCQVEDRTVPHRLMKRVFVDKHGSIASEEDHFFSGRSFFYTAESMTMMEQISMTYRYTGEEDEPSWSIRLDLAPDEIMKRLSLEEADRQLGDWGLKR